MNNQNNNVDMRDLLEIRRDKLKELQEMGRDPYLETRFDVTHYSTEIREGFADLEGKTVAIAGRIMSKRVMGKASFVHIQDGKGQIQSYVRRDELGDDEYAFFKRHHDIGDIVGVVGEVFMTQKGEISVKAHSIKLLSKSLQILPEKYHGLTDKELKYRQRYVDLIMNPEVKDIKGNALLLQSIIEVFPVAAGLAVTVCNGITDRHDFDLIERFYLLCGLEKV